MRGGEVKMKVGYISKLHGSCAEDARYFKDFDNAEWELEDLLNDAEQLIKEACEFAWNADDGWEWIKDGTEITLIIDGKKYGTYEINIELEPVFFASEVK